MIVQYTPWKRSADIARSEGGVDGDVGLRGGFGKNHGGDREIECREGNESMEFERWMCGEEGEEWGGLNRGRRGERS